VLRPLTQFTDPNLLVGLQTSDDAAVYRLSDELAIVQTVDFFTPIVDDPWTFGAIAAANSMSDVYAMGGDVRIALNIAAFPADFPPEIIAAVFEGGATKVREAGGTIAGGHTVTDDEPKYGLSVTGVIRPDRIWTKAGARAGDRLLLTKPIGTGVVTTALKGEAAAAADVEAAVASMLTLNKAAAGVAAEGGIRGCTDITGFGLLGHSAEMAERSQVGLRISAGSVPLLPGARGYAERGFLAGGLGRNRDYYLAQGTVSIDPALDPAVEALLWDPQTSGGLLIAVPAAAAPVLIDRLAAAGVPVWEIGEVVDGDGVRVEQ
jgi:selenide,water dikinase